MRDELTGQMGWRPVLAQYSNPYEETVHVAIRDGESGAVQVIKSNRIHPFFAVRDAGRSSLYTRASATSATSAPPSSEGHRYAGAIEGGAWIDAQHLQKGDRLINADGTWAEVVSVKVSRQKINAYNLSVEDYLTYFVSENETDNPVWVHNARCDINGVQVEIDDKLVFTPDLVDPDGLPPFKDKTFGRLQIDGKDVHIKSGQGIPAEELRGQAMLDNISITHVEGHAAAIMRKTGTQKATITINNPSGPCDNCMRTVRNALPEGAVLTVVWKDAAGVSRSIALKGNSK